MLEDLASSTFGFWAVAWIMTLVDSAFLLEPGTFVFTVQKNLRPQLRSAAIPFTIQQKQLIFSIYSVPFRLFILSSISTPRQPLRKTFKSLTAINRKERRSRSLLIISSVAMLFLVAGPIIAALWSVQYSIIALLPCLYGLAIAASFLIWSERKSFGLSERAALKISAELILCPVCVINVFKRISLSHISRLNVLSIAYFCASPAETLNSIREHQQFFGE